MSYTLAGKTRRIILLAVIISGIVHADTIDPQQEQFLAKYAKQDNTPKAEAMLVNTDAEPELTDGFRSLFNGKDLDGWTPKGGHSKFEAQNGIIVGTCVPGSDSTYLCTDRADFTSFVFTCEMKWLVKGNSGVMFRSRTRQDKRKQKTTVFGPQAEMEGPGRDRCWSGGIYGQSCGGWFYPMWLKAHKAARQALNENGWNRLTILAKGNVVKTWVNGVPAAHWVNDTYLKGFFGLQIHSGKDTVVHWRNLKVKALVGTNTAQSGWEQLPGILKNIKTPTFPDRDFDITRFGAKADGKTDCTEAIKKAISKCHRAGGGRVLVPGNGTYYTGPIHLESNVHLEVSQGATLLFSDDFMDYLPPVLVRWEGEECYSLSPLIYANNCENIAVTGQGTLKGNGKTWWNWRKSEGDPYRAANNIKKEWSQNHKPVTERVLAKKDFHWCPTFIGPYNSKNILIEGLALIDGPFWNVHPVYCQSVIVRNLTIRNHGPNGDGCNPDSCKYVLIEGCLFDTGDDCIAIKSGKNNDGRRVNRPSKYIIVRNCIMKEGHGGVVMGSEMTGSVRNVYAENCEMDSPNLDRALRIKTNSVRGGTVENVYMRNVKVGQVADAVFKVNFQYGEKDTGEFTPMVRNINMENVTCNKSKYGLRMDAYERSPVSGIYLKNCSFKNVEKGNILNHIENLKVDNVTINGKSVNDKLEAR